MVRDISCSPVSMCAYLTEAPPALHGATVALIDDRRLMRDCIALLLDQQAADLSVVTFSKIEDIDLEELSLAVIWIDDRDSISGQLLVDRVDAIRQRFANAPIAAFVEFGDHLLIKTAINLGITLLVLETTTREIAVAAIRLALAGGVFASPELLLPQFDEVQNGAKFAISGSSRAVVNPALLQTTPRELPPNYDPRYEPHTPLYPGHSRHCAAQTSASLAYCRFTRREIEILACLNRGLQNKTIAFELGISDSTVKVHLRNIMKKLHATNRTQAIFLLRQLSVDPLSSQPGVHSASVGNS